MWWAPHHMYAGSRMASTAPCLTASLSRGAGSSALFSQMNTAVPLPAVFCLCPPEHLLKGLPKSELLDALHQLKTNKQWLRCIFPALDLAFPTEISKKHSAPSRPDNKHCFLVEYQTQGNQVTLQKLNNKDFSTISCTSVPFA